MIQVFLSHHKNDIKIPPKSIYSWLSNVSLNWIFFYWKKFEKLHLDKQRHSPIYYSMFFVRMQINRCFFCDLCRYEKMNWIAKGNIPFPFKIISSIIFFDSLRHSLNERIHAETYKKHSDLDKSCQRGYGLFLSFLLWLSIRIQFTNFLNVKPHR